MLARADLEALDGVGGTMLDAFVAFFEEPHNLESLDAMLAVNNPTPLEAVAADTAIAGKTIVFTGTLSVWPR